MIEDCRDELNNILNILKEAKLKANIPVKMYLKMLKEPRFFDCLVETLNSSNIWDKNFAAIILARQGHKEACNILLDLLQTNNSTSVIMALGDARYKEAVKPLILILGDKAKPFWLQEAAAEALGNIGDEQAIDLLLEVFLDEHADDIITDNYTSIRATAAKSLGKYGNKTLPVFLASMKSKNPQTQLLATETLGSIGEKEAIPLLVSALDSESNNIRRAAVKSLGQIGDRSVSDSIFDILEKGEGFIKIEAALALAKLEDKRAINTLVQILGNPKLSPFDRSKAAYFLGLLKEQKAFEPLLEALKTNVSIVRVSAAQALARIGDKRAIQALEFALINTKGVIGFNVEDAKAIELAITQIQTNT